MANIGISLDPVLKSNFSGTNDYVYIVAFNGGVPTFDPTNSATWNGTNGSPALFTGTTASGSNYYALISAGQDQTASLDLELATGNGTYWPANYYIVTTHNGALDQIYPANAPQVNRPSLFGFNGYLSSLAYSGTYGYNFTMVEGDILGNKSDQLDVSAINFYGPNVTVSVPGMPTGYNSTTGFHNSFNTLKQNIISAAGASGQNAVQTNYPTNPVYEIIGTPPSQNGNVWYGGNSGQNLTTGLLGSAFDSYLTDLSTNSSLLNGMMFSTNGNSFLALMRVTYDGTNQQSPFELVPLFQNLPYQPGGTATIQTPTITQTWIKDTSSGDNITAPFTLENIISGIANPPGGTDATAEAIQMFLGGTETGMWASQGSYINPNTTNTLVNWTSPTSAKVDLSQSWNWAQYYAYDAASAIGQKSLGNLDFSNVSVTSGLNNGNGYYDLYSGTLLQSGTPYGWAYSDLLSNRGGLNPQVNFGVSTQNENFNLYVWDDTTTPTTNFIEPVSGYVKATGQAAGQFYAPASNFVLNNYLDWYNPNGNGPGQPTQATEPQITLVNENSLLLDFRWIAGTQQLMPDAGYPITLRIYNPLSTSANKQSDGFVNVTLTQAGPPADPSNPSPWKTYFLNSDYSVHAYDTPFAGIPGEYGYGATPKIQATGQDGLYNLYGVSPGQIIIENLPTTASGTPGWYQLVIGEIGSPAQTVYDIYPKSLGSGMGDVTASAVANVYDGLSVGDAAGGPIHKQLEAGHSIYFSAGPNTLMNTSNNGLTWNPLALFDYDSLFVGIQYQMILGRTPDAPGFGYWTQQLDSGQKTQAVVTTVFLNSEGVPSLSNEQFVDSLYLNGFGRAGDPGGVNYWTNQLNTQAMTRTDVATLFTDSPEMWTPNSLINVYTVGNNISVLEWP